MTNSIADIVDADVLLVTGSNTTEAHPVISLQMKKAVRQRGAKLILIDPRRIGLANFCLFAFKASDPAPMWLSLTRWLM
ncbi:MAG: molybdopterin-dependent oxidoreductase [Chloroflexota bacterium]